MFENEKVLEELEKIDISNVELVSYEEYQSYVAGNSPVKVKLKDLFNIKDRDKIKWNRQD
jgi:hypothetical protein